MSGLTHFVYQLCTVQRRKEKGGREGFKTSNELLEKCFLGEIVWEHCNLYPFWEASLWPCILRSFCSNQKSTEPSVSKITCSFNAYPLTTINIWWKILCKCYTESLFFVGNFTKWPDKHCSQWGEDGYQCEDLTGNITRRPMHSWPHVAQIYLTSLISQCFPTLSLLLLQPNSVVKCP